VKNRVSDCCSG